MRFKSQYEFTGLPLIYTHSPFYDLFVQNIQLGVLLKLRNTGESLKYLP